MTKRYDTLQIGLRHAEGRWTSGAMGLLVHDSAKWRD